MACKLQVELAISHMVQPLLKQHKVDFAKTRRCQLRMQKHTVRNEHGSCVQFADLPLVNSVDKLVRTTEHKQNDKLTHHISRIKAPGGGGVTS